MSMTFSLEGNIGCGKTTLLRILEKELPNISIINEPLSEWENVAQGKVNLLELYYKDPQRWGLTFQNYALFTRVRRWKQNQNSQGSQIKISQRSLEADKEIFALAMRDERYLSEDEYAIYLDYYEGYIKMLDIKPMKGKIYLRCPPEICESRINKRNREGEGAIPLSYLTLLHKKHEEWLSNSEDVLVLDTSIDFEENGDERSKILSQISDYLRSYKNQ